MSDKTLFYRSCSAPGFGLAWLWRCCFGLAGVAEFCPDSGHGTGCATVEAAVGAVGTESRQLGMPMPPNSPIRRVAPAMRGIQRRRRSLLTSCKTASTALARLSREYVNLL